MCTIVVVRGGLVPGAFEIYANRDEALDRRWQMPTLRRRGGRKILAPRDQEAGGSWLGVNDAGVFVGLTNRFGCPSPPEAKSRGRLVLKGLEADSAEEAAHQLQGIDGSAYGGFHFVATDASGIHLLWADGEMLHTHRVQQEAWVVSERSYGAADSQRLRRWQKRLADLEERSPDEEQWRIWLAEHSSNAPFEGTCVHLDERNYGTRSSAIIKRRKGQWEFKHSDGPPCRGTYRAFEHLLES